LLSVTGDNKLGGRISQKKQNTGRLTSVLIQTQ